MLRLTRFTSDLNLRQMQPSSEVPSKPSTKERRFFAVIVWLINLTSFKCWLYTRSLLQIYLYILLFKHFFKRRKTVVTLAF